MDPELEALIRARTPEQRAASKRRNEASKAFRERFGFLPRLRRNQTVDEQCDLMLMSVETGTIQAGVEQAPPGTVLD